ncbi:hypothetical protein ElyMa_000643900 [Elysia marginata]|uniref:Uncharacterized protein n=1 Tax=Elysia marginata TaxID=1093978 RepID=A0AAV4GDR5_9GAST|nr:hypothetical protein ElyMa_000643900 [Elysia marginata]
MRTVARIAQPSCKQGSHHKETLNDGDAENYPHASDDSDIDIPRGSPTKLYKGWYFGATGMANAVYDYGLPHAGDSGVLGLRPPNIQMQVMNSN